MESRCTGDHNNPMTATWLQQQTGETPSDSAVAVRPTPLRMYLHNDQALTMVLCCTNATFIH